MLYMDKYLKKPKPEAIKLSLPPDGHTAVSAAISLKRIADQMDTNVSRLLAQISERTGKISESTSRIARNS